MASELWWASIGGNSCEPIRVTKDADDKPSEWFSIGCADPHPMAMEGVLLIEQIVKDDIPLTPKEARNAERRWQRAQAKQPTLGYRRFD